MTLRSLRLSPRPALSATRLAVALMLGSLAAQPAWAARLGHSRVISAVDAPLQVLITISDLTPDERDSLQVSMANAAAWERAGLTPPVPLSTMTLRVEDGPDRSRKNVRLTSTEVARDQAVDLLFNLGSGTSQRQVQVTVMQSGKGFPGGLSQATVGTPSRTGQGGGTVGVRQGDTLYGIAQSRAVADATIYQMLVALWQANPRAFIQNNMNLVKAGATLTIPDAATVRAIDPAQARRIFLEQQEAYARYRANLAAAAGRGAAAAAGAGTSGQVSSPAAAPQPESTAQDRVRLSSGQPGQGSAADQAQARGDAETSAVKATRDAESRVSQLEQNVKDLNAALAGSQGQAAGTGTTAAGAGRGGSADAGGINAGAAGGNAGGATAAQGSSPAAGAPSAAGGAAAGAAGQSGTAAQAGSGGAAGTAGAPSGTTATQGATGASGASSAPSGTGSTGASGANGASGSAAVSGAPGVSGDASSLGTPGVAGAPGAAPNGAGLSAGAGSTAPPSANGSSAAGAGTGAGSGVGGGANPAAPAAGSTGATGGTSGNTGAATPGVGSGATAANGASEQGTAPSSPAKVDSSGLPAWLSDNLLIVVTIVLALIAFIIAWLLRRAGARRDDDAEDMDEDMYASEIDPGAIDRRLEGIDLDLNAPASDSGGRREPGTIRT